MGEENSELVLTTESGKTGNLGGNFNTQRGKELVGKRTLAKYSCGRGGNEGDWSTSICADVKKGNWSKKKVTRSAIKKAEKK